jgi:hypothetical protein
MTASQVTVEVVCDEFPDKIRTVTKMASELPQKFFISYIDLLRPELRDGTFPTDPVSGFFYRNRASYLNHERPLRPLNLIDTIVANAVKGETDEPMLIEFTARNKAA